MSVLHYLRNQVTHWVAYCITNRLRVPRDVVRWACRRYASRPALITESGVWTFAQLHGRSLRLAQALHAAGLGPGKVVLYQVADGNVLLEIRFAAYECGAIAAFLPVFAATTQVFELLSAVRPSLVIAAPGSDLALACADQTGLLVLAGPQYEDWLEAYPALCVDVPILEDSVSAIGATSGTTGVPKLMAQSHGAQAMSLRMLIRNTDLASPAVTAGACMSAIPLGGAGSGLVLPALLSGTALVVAPSGVTSILVDYIERHQVVRLFLTPSQLIDLLDLPQGDLARLRSLRQIIYGTESMPVPKLWEALQHFGPILQQGYGSAEVLPPVAMLSASDHRKALESGDPERLRSSGKVARGVRVEVVDNAGHRLPAGEVGFIRVNSATRFVGYWSPAGIHDPQKNEPLLMGDVGYLSADCYLYVLGRQADAIYVRHGGAEVRVFPRKVEEALHQHPAVKEVALVAIEVQGQQRLYVAVVLRQNYRRLRAGPDVPSGRELLEFLRPHVPPEAFPQGLVFMDQLPRSPLGKMVRSGVRDHVVQKLAVGVDAFSTQVPTDGAVDALGL
ncbi:MAG: AMP-binding protein [Pseudomonadota bacterium]